MAVVREGNGERKLRRCREDNRADNREVNCSGCSARGTPFTDYRPAMLLTDTSAMRTTQRGHETCQHEYGSQECGAFKVRRVC